MTARPVRVAGVTRATAQHPWALLALAREVYNDSVEPVTQAGLWEDLTAPAPGDRVPVDLVREPTNPFDPNAVRVEIPMLADVLGHHRHVGWIPAADSPVFAERMDAGLIPNAWVRSIPIGSPDRMNPGLVILVDWETSPADHFARLT